MSKVIDINTTIDSLPEECSMCKNMDILSYTFVEYSKIRICSNCYNNIPEYFPLEQDSQYVLAFLTKENNDTEKRFAKRNT